MKTQLKNMASGIDLNTIDRKPDGAIILNAKPMRSGTYEYFAFELAGAVDRGFAFDDKIIGELSEETTESLLNTFRGLPVTDEHVFVPVGERSEFSVGTMLDNGTLENGYVNSQALIHDPKTIMKITNRSAEELSIGFYSDIVWNEGRSEGEPHFFITNVELNHVAVVERGRAGPEARLSNHLKLIEEKTMKEIVIGGVTHSVTEEVAAGFSALVNSEADLNAQVSALTGERDTAQGALSAAQAENTRLENTAPDEAAIFEKASAIALAHSKLVSEAGLLGHTDAVEIGSDTDALRRTILANNGMQIADDASTAFIDGAWATAINGKQATEHSAIDTSGGTQESVMVNSQQSNHIDFVTSAYGGKSKTTNPAEG